MMSGRVEPAGLEDLAGASGTAAGGVQSTGLQVPAGDFGWQTARRASSLQYIDPAYRLQMSTISSLVIARCDPTPITRD